MKLRGFVSYQICVARFYTTVGVNSLVTAATHTAVFGRARRTPGPNLGAVAGGKSGFGSDFVKIHTESRGQSRVTSAAGVPSRMDGPRNALTDLIRVMTYNWVGVRTAVWS